MAAEEKSQFVKEIESRLDTLFGEENHLDSKKASPEIVKRNAPEAVPNNSEADALFGNRLSEPTTDRDAFGLAGNGLEKPPAAGSIISDEKTVKSFDAADEVVKEERPAEDKVIVLTEEFSDIKSILHSPLKDLKTSVLSLEWEITPPILQNFDDQIKHLEDIFAGDKIPLGYLRIMRFLGRYIQVKGNKSYPPAVTFLLSIYKNLETITLSSRMAEDRKWDMLLADIAEYKKLVTNLNLLDEGETASEPREAGAVVRQVPDFEPPQAVWDLPDAYDVSGQPEQRQNVMSPHEAFALALEEIKKTISAEFSAIRAELKMWREMQGPSGSRREQTEKSNTFKE